MKIFGIISVIVTLIILYIIGSWMTESVSGLKQQMDFEQQIREISRSNPHY